MNALIEKQKFIGPGYKDTNQAKKQRITYYLDE